MNFNNPIGAELGITVIIINLFFSLFLQLLIIWIYKKTHKQLGYSQGFVFTLMIIGLISTIVMMIVQNNIGGAFALLGMFSLIRFRTIVKETRDIAFVFFALAAGVAVGTSNYAVALIATIFVSTVILIANRLDIASKLNKSGYLLTVIVKSENKLNLERIKEIFDKYVISYDLLQSNAYENNDLEYVFLVNFKNNLESDKMIQEIKDSPNISGVELITTKHNVEY